jgi:hypothetical protein
MRLYITQYTLEGRRTGQQSQTIRVSEIGLRDVSVKCGRRRIPYVKTRAAFAGRKAAGLKALLKARLWSAAGMQLDG